MSTEWLDVQEAARHARCGKGSIYRAVRQGTLRAARLGGRRELRFLAGWIDGWLLSTTTPTTAGPSGPNGTVSEDRVDSSTR